jgi:hypothetical protein
MEIMLPVWPERAATHLAASDLESIKGVSVAFVDDYLDAELADEVEKQLSDVHGAIVKRLIKQSGNTPSPKPLIEQAAQCRVAVVGVAMCGSCTSATVFDAAALEKKGIHTVTIVWDAFEKAARTAARVHGVPDIKFAVIPSRQGSDTAEDQRVKATAAAGEIVQLLLAN